MTRQAPRHTLMVRLVPPLLALVAITLLLRVTSMRGSNVVLGSLDLIIILLGLTLLVFVALTLALQEITVRLSEQSNRRAREKALAEHRRFLRRLDHELKNPLTVLHAGLRGLTYSGMDDQQRRTVQTMEAEVQRLSQLVTGLRKLAELESSSLELHSINLVQFVDDVLMLDQERIESARRMFTLDASTQISELPPLTGDPDLLLLAVHNLLDNALKYTQPGDSISLRISRVEDDLCMQVFDTGIGIPPEDIPLVWEELFRGTGTDHIPGNGIGLALVRAVVERHHGYTSLQSTPELGTTVSIYLPLV